MTVRERNPEGAKVNVATRVPADAPVTFKDLIPEQYQAKTKHFTREEVEALPVSGRWGPPDGWQKTGYLQPQRLLLHHRFVYYNYVDFIRSGNPHDETETSLVLVDGEPLIEVRSNYE